MGRGLAQMPTASLQPTSENWQNYDSTGALELDIVLLGFLPSPPVLALAWSLLPEHAVAIQSTRLWDGY